jgi:hypothetical protein
MTATPTRHVSFSRDNLVQVFSRADVFEKNPGLIDNQSEINDCMAKYRADVSAKGCSCRANPAILFDCFENFLVKLEGLRETEPEVVKKFVYYVTSLPIKEGELVELTVYFRKTGEATDLHRYVFVA